MHSGGTGSQHGSALHPGGASPGVAPGDVYPSEVHGGAMPGPGHAGENRSSVPPRLKRAGFLPSRALAAFLLAGGPDGQPAAEARPGSRAPPVSSTARLLPPFLVFLQFFAGRGASCSRPCVRFRRHDRSFPTHPFQQHGRAPYWDLGPDYGYNGHEPHPPSLHETLSRGEPGRRHPTSSTRTTPPTKITGDAFLSPATDFVQVDKTIGISCFPASRREVASPGPLPTATPLSR